MSPIVIAVICRRCGMPRAASQVPDFCPCGSRFTRDDHAVVETVIHVRGTTIRAETQVRFVGNRWSHAERSGLIDAVKRDAERCASDAGER